MKKMTKAEITKRQLEIMERMSVLEEKAREANNGKIIFTDEQDVEYRSLCTESAGLSTRAKEMASGAELDQIQHREDQGKKLREQIKDCYNKRSAANSVLANAITTGDDQNTTGNLEAGGLIPVRIEEIIDTKVAGLELPDSLRMVTGVTGTDIVPYSTNDVKFTVEGEVTKVAEQRLDFAHQKAKLVRVAASLPVSYRAIDNAAFDIIGFITYKFQKGWAMFRALHIYAHGNYATLPSPFAQVTPVELALDDNIGKNLATEIAKMYDLGFEGDPEIIMDKVTEVALAFTKRIPNSVGDRTVVEDGKCVGYNYKVSPYVDYTLDSDGIATKDASYRYIAIGHFGYLAEQQHGEFRFNIDGTSSANFDRSTVAIGMSTDYSLTDLSKLVNGGDANNPHKPQAFKLIKLIEAESSSDY